MEIALELYSPKESRTQLQLVQKRTCRSHNYSMVENIYQATFASSQWYIPKKLGKSGDDWE